MARSQEHGNLNMWEFIGIVCNLAHLKGESEPFCRQIPTATNEGRIKAFLEELCHWFCEQHT